MADTHPEQALCKRIRELRRRHFGPRGKAAFAEKLGLEATDYERFESGTIPPGDILIRICEQTGEDLQWLLTGVAARGTVVISNAPHRHQELVVRIASLLEQRPELASPIAAFVDVVAEQPAQGRSPAALPPSEAATYMPVFRLAELPDEWPGPNGPGGGYPLVLSAADLQAAPTQAIVLHEPALEYSGAAQVPAARGLLEAGGGRWIGLSSPGVQNLFPGSFAVALDDESMAPMLHAGEAVIITPGTEPQLGKPTVVKLVDAPGCCRVWLGAQADTVLLGRISDGQTEQVPRRRIRWAWEVLYRAAAA